MSERAPMRLSGVTLDAPDPPALARFYQRLLGWPAEDEDSEWVKLRHPETGFGLAFQREPAYSPPTWPARPDAQQMMSHLEIQVDDLAVASAHAVAAGATVARFQPQEGVLVHLDPAGHPFCLFLPGH